VSRKKSRKFGNFPGFLGNFNSGSHVKYGCPEKKKEEKKEVKSYLGANIIEP